MGPKYEVGEKSHGTRYRAREIMTAPIHNPLQEVPWWEYEEQTIGMGPTLGIMVRVLVGKVRRKDRLVSIIRGVPMRPETQDWSCLSWVEEVLDALREDGTVLGAPAPPWIRIRDTAVQFAQEKEAARRFDSPPGDWGFDRTKVPTFDVLQMRAMVD